MRWPKRQNTRNRRKKLKIFSLLGAVIIKLCFYQ